MGIVVLDLEGTCDNSGVISKEESEIIEIGAVYLDSDLNVVSYFQTFVQPVVHRELSAFCTELTGINQTDVVHAPLFSEAMDLLDDWISYLETDIEPVGEWGGWGGYDFWQFKRNALLVEANEPQLIHIPYLNLKNLFAQNCGVHKTKRMGLAKALAHAGMDIDGLHHSALDDAGNAARLMPYIVGGKIIER